MLYTCIFYPPSSRDTSLLATHHYYQHVAIVSMTQPDIELLPWLPGQNRAAYFNNLDRRTIHNLPSEDITLQHLLPKL